jgi:tetratricopeptide (TPR) repeat protein
MIARARPLGRRITPRPTHVRRGSARVLRRCGLTLVLPLWSVAVWAGTSPRYARVVGRYAAGDRATAVDQVGEFSWPDLKRELKALRDEFESGAPVCLECLEQTPLRAALMLHTDRALLERAELRGGEAEPGCSETVQADAAQQIAEITAHRSDLEEFARRWAAAMAMRARADGCMESATHYVDLGLKWFARDPTLLLLRGAVHEAIATLVFRPYKPGLVTVAGESRRRLREAQGILQEYSRHLSLATRSFDQALEADPRQVEARVHLGRTLWLAHQPEKARAALEDALAGEPGPSLAYLAHLFLGRIDEDSGRLADAQSEYRAALAIDPRAQAAGIAFSHALLLAGQESTAREQLETTLHYARRKANDVYWNYEMGSAESADAALARLREESLR